MRVWMTSDKPARAAYLIAVGLLSLQVLTVSAQAQNGPAGVAPTAAPAPAGQAPSRGMQMVGRRIRDLHDKLRITPAQQPQWDAFTAVMLDNAQRMDALHGTLRPANAATPSAVDDMRNYARAAQQHADDLQKLIPPFEALYATMSTDQKRLTDQSFRQFEAREERRHPRGS